MSKTNKILYLVVLIITVVAIGYYIYSDLNTKFSLKADQSLIEKENQKSLPEADQPMAEKNQENGKLIIEKDGIQYEFVETESEEASDIIAPKLKEPIPAGAKKTADKINSGSDSSVLWNDLALYYQSAGDYTMAEEIWAYLNQKWPKNWLSFFNMANLQAYYLRNVSEAEKNYLKTIEIFPGNPGIYIRIHEFYRDIAKNNQKALEIIELGLKNNPKNPLLTSFLQEIKEEIK